MFYTVIFTGLLFELVLHVLSPHLVKVRQPLAMAIILTTGLASFGILVQDFSLYPLLIFTLSIARLFNLARIVKNRMHAFYLAQVTRRTGLIFCLLQVAVLLVMAVQIFYTITLSVPLELFLTAQVLAALGLVLSTARNIVKTRHIPNTTHYSDKELPTVTVAIPARNETRDLEECLASVLANDYAKLEIIVLDDCSQDETADIIKKFANAGVRFIKGADPADRWLAKNPAYQRLLEEATGDVLLFCGVDVRLGPRAIRALVTTMLNRKKSMISVLPKRFYSNWHHAFIQPMRYWWELAPPRRLFNRPPVLSTCWLVSRKKLQKLGGFEAVSHAVLPEGYFAREFVKTDGYSFIRADNELDVQTVKLLDEQRQTAIRTRYPQLRRRPEMVLVVALINLLFLVLPFVQVIMGLLTQNWLLVATSAVTAILLTVVHMLILQASDPANVPVGMVTLPFAFILEFLMGYLSMFAYEFGTIEWKGRNVCIPVMHVVPKLPPLPDSSDKTNV